MEAMLTPHKIESLQNIIKVTRGAYSSFCIIDHNNSVLKKIRTPTLNIS